MAAHTAGSPTNALIKWTNLTHPEIVQLMELEGLKVGIRVVKQLLKKHCYRKRKAQKRQATGSHPQRNEQFENIERLKKRYQKAGNPVLSMDTKKKEYIGNLYRAGQLYTQGGAIEVFDHDWPSLAEGIAIPHGLYDLKLNIGYIHLGNSHDTSEFACEALEHWWREHGSKHYGQAQSILLLCDGGGSNSSRSYLFKADLQETANRLGIEIRIAHYPPYTSKYNPIEHRLFPHLSRACQGVIFESLEQVKDLMSKAKTQKGLKVFVDILDKSYQTGRKVAEDFKKTMAIVFDAYLPQWNYTAQPLSP